MALRENERVNTIPVQEAKDARKRWFYDLNKALKALGKQQDEQQVKEGRIASTEDRVEKPNEPNPVEHQRLFVTEREAACRPGAGDVGLFSVEVVPKAPVQEVAPVSGVQRARESRANLALSQKH
ncbi:hypothetical protein F442_19729 [Phytophthora nicotianae P10297]|uniref:Uncharacterized protein n=1 Tax=Phytophthora nicotianae P10297 TaxID=1317064 RepID=W2Y9J7_PHYNI|nr:hypothetical protein F442_19729 [Phytophthora nicotianae P10297]